MDESTLADLKRDIGLLKNAYITALSEKKKLQSDLQEVEVRKLAADRVNIEAAEQQQKLRILEEQFTKTSAQCRKLQEVVNACQDGSHGADIERLRQKVSEKDQQSSDLQIKLEDRETMIARVKKSNSSAVRRQGHWRALYEKSSHDTSLDIARINTDPKTERAARLLLDQQKLESDNQLRENVEEMEKLAAQVPQLQQSNDSLQQTINLSTSTLSAVNEKLPDKTQEVDNLTSQVSQLNEINQDLQTKISSHGSSLSDVNTKLSEKTQKAASLNTLLSELTRRFNDREQATGQEKDRLETEVKSVKGEIAQLKEKCKKNTWELEQKKSEISKLEIKLKAKKEKEMEEIFKKLASNLRIEQKDIETQLDGQKEENQTLTTANARLEGELKLVSERANSLNAQVTDNARAAQEVVDLKESKIQLSSEIERLKDANTNLGTQVSTLESCFRARDFGVARQLIRKRTVRAARKCQLVNTSWTSIPTSRTCASPYPYLHQSQAARFHHQRWL